jgi:putative phosphonate metabolism protein
MADGMRVAVYYAPAAHDPLWQLGCQWLGRDPESGDLPAQPDIPGIAALTANPRLYGFHATLKPPFHLRHGVSWDTVVTAVDDLAGNLKPFALPKLEVADLHGFIAIRDAEPSAELQALADVCVAELDQLRAPPSAAETVRRRQSKLSPRHLELLERWGYPYVFDAWFFHLTLTRRLSPEEHALVMPRARAYFADTLPAPRMVGGVSLYTQAEPGADFVLAERIAFRG